MRDFMLYVFPVLAIAFMAWAIANAVRNQKKAAARLQGLTQAGDKNFSDVMEVSKRHLAVSEQMLEGLRSIRLLLEQKTK